LWLGFGLHFIYSGDAILAVMKETQKQKRQARDLAFAQLLEDMRPEHALQRQMIAARVRNSWTQQQLALRMGTTQSAIARLESGRISPNVRTLEKLAEVTMSRLKIWLD
jgi:ribosome-binding protein aMBF1 (putative translation factor)